MSWRCSLSKTLHEIGFYFSGSCKHSEGVRKFLLNNYWDFKKLNPMFPFLIKQGSNIDEPYLIAGYHYGREEFIDLKDKTEEEIIQILKETVEKAVKITPNLPCDNMKWQDIVKEEHKYQHPHHLMTILSDENRPSKLGLEVLEKSKKDPNYPTNSSKIQEDMKKYGFK